MTPYFTAPGVTLHNARVEDVLPMLAKESFDGVLCDPPYGLNQVSNDRVIACLTAWLSGEPYQPTGGGFMGREWDAWTPGPEVWSAVNRVLKPGAHHLLASRHRARACAAAPIHAART